LGRGEGWIEWEGLLENVVGWEKGGRGLTFDISPSRLGERGKRGQVMQSGDKINKA
jgi:hypothetical protein